MQPKVIVHGGARDLTDTEPRRKADVEKAGEYAYSLLQEGKSAVDAVEAAIKIMESSPYLNAGVGSYLQLDGIVRMDASIMTSDLRAGAVISIEDVEHPISVARKVMENTQHVILSGSLAKDFARAEGFPRFDTRTRDNVELWLDIIEEFKHQTTYEQIYHVDKYLKTGKHTLGTVGCVAMDDTGMIVAGTSTGGLKMNVPGRVGDSPILGAGTYACKDGGVSCTGIGEKILVLGLAKSVTNFLRYNPSSYAQDAAEYGVNELNTINADGGMIIIDKNGNIGHKCNTEVMTMHSIE